MPYAPPITHLRVEGVTGATVAGAVESWSFGFHFAGAMLPEGYESALPAIWGHASTLIKTNTAEGAAFHPDVWLTEVMAAEKGADGRLVQGYYTRYASTPVRGAASQAASAPVPYQTALAVTLDAGKPSAGRFNRSYLPTPAGGDLAGGLMSAARALSYATRFKVFLEGVESAFTDVGAAGLDVTVASARYGTNRRVKEIRVGRVLDTVRSRRTSLSEDYQAVAWTL